MASTLQKLNDAFHACGVRLTDCLTVGVSGGPDSVALLHMLWALGARGLHAAHLNHCIRGQEADADAAFVEALCAGLRIPCTVAREDVPARARESGMSIEEAAREARYAFLREIARERGGYILTAHHRDDQAETVLMHLLRGSALRGLCGMRMLSGGLFRPLLHTGREEIMAYVAREGLHYRTDRTNADTAYRRNHVRLKLMPALTQYNPNISAALSSMADMLAADEAYLSARAEDALNDAALEEPQAYDRVKLSALEAPIRTRALRAALERADVLYDSAAIARMDALLTAQTGRTAHLRGGMRAEASYGLIRIAHVQSNTEAYAAPLNLSGETLVPGGRFIASRVQALRKDEGPYVAYLDLDKLPEGILARPRAPGERFHPLGAPGGRKLKEYLIDKKVPRAKRGVPLIAAGQEVLFFPGCTISERVRVSEGTRHILRLEYRRDSE